MCMYEENTDRVRRKCLTFQGALAHKKGKQIEKRLRERRGGYGEC